jgi:hypothetical protein
MFLRNILLSCFGGGHWRHVQPRLLYEIAATNIYWLMWICSAHWRCRVLVVGKWLLFPREQRLLWLSVNRWKMEDDAVGLESPM